MENKITIENERNVKCGSCNNWRTEQDFISNDRRLKTCNKCRERSKKFRIENVDKIKEQRQQYNIKNADKIKEQQKQHYQEIKEQRKQHYKENKEVILEKNKQHYQKNKEVILEKIKKYKNEHKQEIKEYQKQNYETEKKENSLHIKILNMINSSKTRDKKYNRTYDADEYIDYDFLNELWVKQNKKCFYEDCECELILCFNKDTREDNMLTIQRLNNKIAHIKSNSVLSCFRCNVIAHKELNELN